MTRFPQTEVPIDNTQRAEIEALFIELMRERDATEQTLEEAADPLIEAHRVDTSDGAAGRTA